MHADRDIRGLLTVVLSLLTLSVVMIYSASAIVAEMNPKFGDPYFFLRRQFLWIAVSVIWMISVSWVPTDWWSRLRIPVLVAGLAMLVAVMIPGIGTEANGARRWIRFAGMGIQPSEVAKFCLLVFVAGHLGREASEEQPFLRGALPVLLATALVCGLVLIEPDIGTAVFTAGVMALVMYLGGVQWKHLLPIGGVGLAAGAVLFAAKQEHVIRRIHEWVDGTGHQTRQALIALGSGGWLGEGLGRGHAKLFYLPEQYNDFILPVIGEELGLAGTLGTLILFIMLFFCGIRIARRAGNRFSILLSYGILLLIMCQAAMNIAVVTNAMPTKGISLPFVSYGGSSLILVMTGIGVLMRVAEENRYSIHEAAGVREPDDSADSGFDAPEEEGLQPAAL
jgi:cell division protein FtsW